MYEPPEFLRLSCHCVENGNKEQGDNDLQLICQEKNIMLMYFLST